MKPYARYSDVAGGWIRRVPSHWQVKAVKHVCSFNDEVISERTDPNSLIEYVEISDVDEVQGLKGSQTMPFKDAPSRARRRVQHGDVILSTVRTYLRAVASIKTPAENLVVSTGFVVLRPQEIDSGFAQYAFVADGFIGSVIARSTGVSYPAINASDLVRIAVPIPPRDEQRFIASYLDVEMARIDVLIQAKLDLKSKLEGFANSTFLAEVLDCAKALPGTAVDRMQWLPTVPSAWIRCKVKHLVEHFDQGVSPQCESRPPSEDEWGVLKAGCINSGSFNPMESKALPPEIESIPEVTVSKNDLIISRANTQSLVGRSAVAEKDYPKLMLSDKLYRLKLDRLRCVPEFIRRTLWIPAVRQRIEERATGASPSMLNIDRRTILELDVVLPPVPEQLRMLKIVDQRADAIAELIGHVDRELDLLHDLRSSTITDAVLGRIDVRPIVQNKNELEAT